MAFGFITGLVLRSAIAGVTAAARHRGGRGSVYGRRTDGRYRGRGRYAAVSAADARQRRLARLAMGRQARAIYRQELIMVARHEFKQHTGRLFRPRVRGRTSGQASITLREDFPSTRFSGAGGRNRGQYAYVLNFSPRKSRKGEHFIQYARIFAERRIYRETIARYVFFTGKR